MKYIIMLLALILFIYNAEAKMITKYVEYIEGNTLLEGYLAYDESKGKQPAVIVVHEWTGINDYTIKRCNQLAEMGFIAFAADIYGKGIRPQTMQDAANESGKYKKNVPLLRARINSALSYVKDLKFVDDSKIAAIGYCFGGTAVLELARSGADVGAVVSFHGGLSTPNISDAVNIKASVLVLHGADDPYVSNEELSNFENEMRSANVDWQLIKYSGAVHSFTNPSAGNDNSKGAAYNEKADKRSWEDMKQFFNEFLK